MTQLHIKLHQPYAQGYIEAGATARVRWLSDVVGNRVKPSWSQEKPVDIAGVDGSTGAHAQFDLPGGGYYGVDITLPRGAGISREFLVQENQVLQETITMDVSPHEYLGWQQYAGIVGWHPRSSSRAERFGLLSAKEKSGLESLGPRISDVPNVFVRDLPAAGSAWALLAEFALKGRHESLLPRRLPAGIATDWMPRSEDEFVTWFPRMPDANEGMALIGQLQQGIPPSIGVQPPFSRWMSFETAGKLDLASVPWHWWGAGRNQDEQIRFLYDRSRPDPVNRASPGRFTMTLQDRRWFGLLEFLASGRLSHASDMTEEIFRKEAPQEALAGKLKGPLAAVAGGIVLIAHAQTVERQVWDSWLENLTNWFPGIPDGPILLGCRRLQQAANQSEIRGAYDRLCEGMMRGIPFFSASIRMLDLAIAQIGDQIPEADEWRHTLGPVLTRIDPDQAFTVIRL